MDATLLASLAVITPFAVVDTLAFLPGNLLCLVPLVASRRPVFATSAYTVGLFAGGVLSGVVVALGLGQLTQWVVDNIEVINRPGPVFLTVQGLIGLALLATGLRLLRRRSTPRQVSAPADAASGAVLVALGAFAFALVGMFTRLPIALPYLATIDRLLKMPTPPEVKLAGLVYHNLLLIAPYVLLMVLFLAAPRLGERVFTAVQNWLRYWWRPVIAILLIVLGGVLAADALGHKLGRPLLPVIEVQHPRGAFPSSGAGLKAPDG